MTKQKILKFKRGHFYAQLTRKYPSNILQSCQEILHVRNLILLQFIACVISFHKVVIQV